MSQLGITMICCRLTNCSALWSMCVVCWCMCHCPIVCNTYPLPHFGPNSKDPTALTSKSSHHQKETAQLWLSEGSGCMAPPSSRSIRPMLGQSLPVLQEKQCYVHCSEIVLVVTQKRGHMQQPLPPQLSQLSHWQDQAFHSISQMTTTTNSHIPHYPCPQWPGKASLMNKIQV